SALPLRSPVAAGVGGSGAGFSHPEEADPNSGIRREPTLPEHEAMVAEEPRPSREFAIVEDEPDDDDVRAKALRQHMRNLARQASMDPNDGIEL
ncbi:MAG TPA: conjugal transfer protein TraG, partial [Sphingomicrobium sp.]